MKKELAQKTIIILLALATSAVFFSGILRAQEILPSTPVHILIRLEGEVILEEDATLPDPGATSILDEGGSPHDIDSRSVLGVLYFLDRTSDLFSISKSTYYASFSSLYVNCMEVDGNEKCDYWMYKVNGDMPSAGMDSNILSGGETIEIYFDSSFFGSAPEEPEPAPVSEPEPEPAKPRQSRSSRKLRRSLTQEESVPAGPAETIVVPVAEPTTESVSEPEEVNEVSAPAPAKKPEKFTAVAPEIKPLKAENLTASVIAGSEITELPAPKKANWFVSLFKKLFGF